VNVSRLFIALRPNERASNASLWRICFDQAKDEEMRDFRDAKAMAHTLRAALTAKGPGGGPIAPAIETNRQIAHKSPSQTLDKWFTRVWIEVASTDEARLS
jgi:hypothetical protein